MKKLILIWPLPLCRWPLYADTPTTDDREEARAEARDRGQPGSDASPSRTGAATTSDHRCEDARGEPRPQGQPVSRREVDLHRRSAL